jgi:hypothetical protein
MFPNKKKKKIFLKKVTFKQVNERLFDTTYGYRVLQGY